MRVICGQKERVSKWVAARIGCQPWVMDYEAFGVERDGVLVAGVVVDGYVEKARCSIHCAGIGGHWLSRPLLRVVFSYVFIQLGCKVVINPVSSSNTKSLRFTRKLGFTDAAVVEGGCTDGDLIILKLPRAACRWLETNDAI